MFDVTHLSELRAQMREDGLKAYLILTGDPHNSEIAAGHFLSERTYFCPFTGSAGQVLVTLTKAYLFTDGRYFIQAAEQLKGSTIELMRIGEKGVLPLVGFIKAEDLYPLGINGLIAGERFFESLQEEGRKVVDVDYYFLVKDRPPLSKAKVFRLDPSLNSLTAQEKINVILSKAASEKAEAVLVTTLDDIAWILNIRGNDIPCTPLFYSYLYLSSAEGAHLFVDPDKIDFTLDGVTVHPYEDIMPFLEKRGGIPTLADPDRANSRLYSMLNKPIQGEIPSYLMKAVKGETEIEHIRESHVTDGVAMLKFIDFVDTHADGSLSEYGFAEALQGFRFENSKCFELSFETIAAVDANAAEMHYEPTEDHASKVGPDSMELLVDSGGHYYGGTTDTTRTFLLGKPNDEFRHDYTLTLKSVIALSKTVFIDGATGRSLDLAARGFMWDEGMDYKCGTGHGVGYMLNVHEGPNGFRYKRVAERDDGAKIVPGMITTVEPGVYKEGKYGIRIENNLLCVPAFETAMGVFYKFETLTMVPIDTKPLDLSIMTDGEISWLNSYHQMVYDKLKGLVSGHLLDVLREKTRPVRR